MELELQRTKTYYTKRIREIEDKYKYGGKSTGRSEKPDSSRIEKPPTGSDSKELFALKEKNE